MACVKSLKKAIFFSLLSSGFSQMYLSIQNYATQNWCNRHVLYVVHLYPLDIQNVAFSQAVADSMELRGELVDSESVALLDGVQI